MLIKGKDKGTDSTRTAGNDCISQRNDDSSAIQIPEGLLDIGPKAIVRRNIDHDVPESLEFLAHSFRAKGASYFTADDAANSQIARLGRKGQMTERILPLAEQVLEMSDGRISASSHPLSAIR